MILRSYENNNNNQINNREKLTEDINHKDLLIGWIQIKFKN
ncbi:MAG: hypothetical protein ACFE85_16675 [Candidatus Hodarchaeota archaeon]